MATSIRREALPHSTTAYRFEGQDYGGVGVPFFLIDAPPGGGPVLHTHPCTEVFVIQKGEVIITVGDKTIPAHAGQIAIVPPQTPHKYRNAGKGQTRHIDIHTAATMETTWLAE